MDGDARRAFDAAVRQVVSADLDALSVEVARMRQELTAVRLAAGLPAGRARPAERREMVAMLRDRGLSRKAIGLALGVTAETVRVDARELGLPPATQSVGLDGAVRRHRVDGGDLLSG